MAILVDHAVCGNQATTTPSSQQPTSSATAQCSTRVQQQNTAASTTRVKHPPAQIKTSTTRADDKPAPFSVMSELLNPFKYLLHMHAKGSPGEPSTGSSPTPTSSPAPLQSDTATDGVSTSSALPNMSRPLAMPHDIVSPAPQHPPRTTSRFMNILRPRTPLETADGSTKSKPTPLPSRMSGGQILCSELRVSELELTEVISPLKPLLERDQLRRRQQSLSTRKSENAGGLVNTAQNASLSQFVSTTMDVSSGSVSASADLPAPSSPTPAVSSATIEALPATDAPTGTDCLDFLPHIDRGGLCDKYGRCCKVLGKGTGGVVKLLKRPSDGKIFAVKEFRKRKNNESKRDYIKSLTTEYCIGSILHHPNVVETIDMVVENGKYYEIMEYCATDLFSIIQLGKYGIQEANCCFKQLVCGVAYLHSQGIAHRDLKPENIVIDENARCKIIDFGVSEVITTEFDHHPRKSKGLCGSAPFIAPEQWSQQEYDAREVDIWACGIIYLTMVYHAFPWRTTRDDDPNFLSYTRMHKRCTSQSQGTVTPCPLFSSLDLACQQLLTQILDPNPRTRATLDDILASPWFQAIEVCQDCRTESNAVHRHFLPANKLSKHR